MRESVTLEGGKAFKLLDFYLYVCAFIFKFESLFNFKYYHHNYLVCSFRYSGPTIHYVDEEYDRGRILAQRVVPVLAHDTVEELAARVLHEVSSFSAARVLKSVAAHLTGLPCISCYVPCKM